MTQTRRQKEKTLALMTALFLALGAIFSTIYFFRMDFTSARSYSLSATAKKLHSELPQTVRITYYISKSLSNRHPGAQAIEDLLRELEAVSRGKISVKIQDPGNDGSKAEALGVTPQQMQVVEKSEQRVALVYTGIVMEYLDRHQTIPAVISTETLEYELIKAVRSLVSDKRQVAGLLIGDGDKTLEGDYGRLADVLSRGGYEIVTIQRGKPVQSDVSVLFVLGNSSIDRYDSYFIDSFLMGGGKVFFAAKSVDVKPENNLVAQALPQSGVPALLAAYGVSLPPELVLDESNLTVPFQSASQQGRMTIQYVPYPHWIAVQKRFANKNSPVTARFSGLDLYWPAPLVLAAQSPLQFTVLASSTPRAWKQTSNYATSPQDQALYFTEQESTRGSYALAVSASGTLPSAFANGDLPTRDGSDPLPPPAKKSGDVRFIVVSSADFLTDLMSMMKSDFNAGFALSGADWLTQSEDLIAVRSRVERNMRLNKIENPDVRAAMINFTYAVNIALIPLGIALVGVFRAVRRNRREKQARAMRGGEA